MLERDNASWRGSGPQEPLPLYFISRSVCAISEPFSIFQTPGLSRGRDALALMSAPDPSQTNDDYETCQSVAWNSMIATHRKNIPTYATVQRVECIKKLDVVAKLPRSGKKLETEPRLMIAGSEFIWSQGPKDLRERGAHALVLANRREKRSNAKILPV
jgi:hypothetical protein